MKSKRKSKTRSTSLSAESIPPWTELPREITAKILQKLGAIEMILTAESVCPTWRSVCRDAATWRSIDLRDEDGEWEQDYDLEKMCRLAVDRSKGELIDLNIEFIGTDDMLQYVAERSNQLKRLRLVSCHMITSEGLIKALRKFPLLEELQIYYTYMSAKSIEFVGRSCPNLKSFKLNERWYQRQQSVRDSKALAVAKNMPELRHLQLLGNKMTNEGLQAILDRCVHLESLDIRQCFNIHKGPDLKGLCSQRVKTVRLPGDPTDDFGFDDELYEQESSDSDYEAGASDIDAYDYEITGGFGSASFCPYDYDDDF